MGKKVNVYLNEEMLNMWERIPPGNRSTVIQGAIRDHDNRLREDPRIELLVGAREELAAVESNIERLQQTQRNLINKITSLEAGAEDITRIQIDTDDFWSTLKERADLYQKENMNYRSFTGKSYYRIHSTDDDRIQIHNVRTGRTTSHFSRKTVDPALDRLMASGGSLPVGQFIPVKKMHEYTVVTLHPYLYEKDGFIHWGQEDMIEVDESMIPENYDNVPMAPTVWESTEHWLAVTVDGKRGHVCIHHRAYASTKIIIAMLDDHPHFSLDYDGDWATKHFRFYGYGILFWGHHFKDGGGGTQVVLTPTN